MMRPTLYSVAVISAILPVLCISKPAIRILAKGLGATGFLWIQDAGGQPSALYFDVLGPGNFLLTSTNSVPYKIPAKDWKSGEGEFEFHEISRAGYSGDEIIVKCHMTGDRVDKSATSEWSITTRPDVYVGGKAWEAIDCPEINGITLVCPDKPASFKCIVPR